MFFFFLNQDYVIPYGGYKSILNKELYEKKKVNLKAFYDIERSNLCPGKIEKRILLYETKYNEQIYMNYPGKECKRKKYKYPYDFRAEIAKDGEQLAYLSIADICESLMFYGYRNRGDSIHRLSSFLVKIAYMLDYEYTSKEYKTDKVSIVNKEEKITEDKSERIDCYRLTFSEMEEDILEEMLPIRIANKNHQEFIDISVKSFLYFTEVLAQQEDCKYFYKSYKNKKETHEIGIGRINYVLTMVKILYHSLNEKPVGPVIKKINGNSFPISVNKIQECTNNLVECKSIPSEEQIKDIDIKDLFENEFDIRE